MGTNKTQQKETEASTWTDLDWDKKVTICEQGRATENNLVQSYRLIFIAMGTIILIGAFSVAWTDWRGGLLGIVGVLLAILWFFTCSKRVALVDHWEVMLAGLWRQANLSWIVEHYSEAERRLRYIERVKRRRCGWLRQYLPPAAKDMHHARWVLNFIAPIVLLLLSLWVIFNCFLICAN